MKKYCIAGILLGVIAVIALILYAATPKLTLPETKEEPETKEKTEPILDPYAEELVEAGFPVSYAILL